MKARLHRVPIRTSFHRDVPNHMEIQTPVVTMVARLFQSWNPFPEYISKVKQTWELWSVNVALAMSTWNDIAVTYWHQVYHHSEESYRDWRRSSMTKKFACEKRYLYGRKAPVPATCDSVEALLRHELLAHLPEWLNRKAVVLGCTSSPTILFMC